MKITEKVLFKTASEASNVYIFSRQKFIKNAIDGQVLILRVFGNLRPNSVTRQVNFNRTKNGRNAKIKMWHFWWFWYTVQKKVIGKWSKITYCVFNILAFGYWNNSTRILFTFSFTFWCFSKTLGKRWTWFQFLGCHWVTICCAWRTLLDPFKSITSFYCKNLSKKGKK